MAFKDYSNGSGSKDGFLSGVPGANIVSGGSQIGQGLVSAIGSLFGGRKRRREQRRAKKEWNVLKQKYTDQDTSNMYLGQDNMYEDLTVNQEAAKFTSEQQNQGLANILDSNNQAAGGSGIAAMAQALANQQSQNIRTTAIGIGEQEQQNQMLERGDAGRIQSEEIQGEYGKRAAELERDETLLGMSGERLAAANKAREDATGALVGGIGNVVGGALTIGEGLINPMG